MTSEHVAIIGASLAGIRAAEGLRRGGHQGPITLVGAEPRPPYSRPPLSKQVLDGSWEPERAELQSSDKLDALDLDLRLGVRAEALDTDRRVVSLSDGELTYDSLVIATGATPRRLAGEVPVGVRVLRDLDDALAIRRAMESGARVVVVGAGFVGCEVASVARKRGLHVTVVEPQGAPMVRGLGTELGAVAGELHVEHGVDLRCGIGVTGFEGGAAVEAVVLSDGTSVAADLVVVGIGVVPTTDWLVGSRLELDDGIVCDSTLAAEGVDGVWAAGDVARWYHPGYGEAVRFEHWTVAAEHGRAVAANILAGPKDVVPHAPVPYVWSDQFGTKIQIVGRPAPDDEVHLVHGAFEDRRFVAVRTRSGSVTGAVGFAAPRALMSILVRLEEGSLALDEVREVVAA